VEEAYVSVPVTDAVLGPPNEDGMRQTDGAAVLAAAVALGQEHATWLPEVQEIDVHPIQKAPPEGATP
jgi:hypothetical protein